MSFLAIRGKCTLQLSSRVDAVSSAPIQSVYNSKHKGSNSKRKKRLRHGLGGSYAIGVDSSWHGGRARTSEELSRADQSRHGPSLNTLGIAACWAGLKAYAFIAPAKASSQPQMDADKSALFHLLTPPGSTPQQAAALSAHLESLLRVLLLWPALHEAAEARKAAALRSWGYAGKVQHQSSWPLAGASFAFGACAFLPLLASFTVKEGQLQQAVLRSVETQLDEPLSPALRHSCDSIVLGMRAAPLPALPPALLAAALSSIHQAMISAGDSWASYSPLLSECRLMRAPTLDFLHLTAQHTEGAEDGTGLWDRSNTWLPVLRTLHAVCPATLSLLLVPHHPKHPRQLAKRLHALLKTPPTKLISVGSSSSGICSRSSGPVLVHRNSTSDATLSSGCSGATSSSSSSSSSSKGGGSQRRSSCSGALPSSTLHSAKHSSALRDSAVHSGAIHSSALRGSALSIASCDGSSSSSSSLCRSSGGSGNSSASSSSSGSGSSSSSDKAAGAARSRSAACALSPLGRQPPQPQHRRCKSSVDLLCCSDMAVMGGSPPPIAEGAQQQGNNGGKRASRGGSSGGLWTGAKCLAYQLVVPAY